MGVGKIKRIRKKLFTIIVISIFISIIFTDAVCAEDPKQKLTICLPGVTEDNYSVQLDVTKEEYQSIYYKLNVLLEVINSSVSQESPEGAEITIEEWQEIAVSINDIINSIKLLDENFPNYNTEQLVTDIIDALFDPLGGFFRPEPVISFGFGFTIIPFYNYDTFFGIVIRPMFTRYIFGYTRIGGLLSHYRKIGSYSMLSIMFA